MPTIRSAALFFIVALLATGAPEAQAPQPSGDLETAAKAAEQAGRLQDAFDLYMRAVQALPDPPPLEDDVRLRGQIVALALRLQPRPATPENAERFAVRGQVLLRDGNDPAAFKKAEVELRKAVRAAPWVPDFAYNLALVQEKREHYRAAAANLKMYLLASPPDATEVRAKMYEFELKREDEQVAAKEDNDDRPIPPPPAAAPAPPAPASLGPQTNSPAILIHVSPPMKDGFMDASKELSDSMKDLQRELSGKKEVALSPTPDGADVLLIVTNRYERADGSKCVETELKVDDFKKEFGRCYSGGSLRSLWGADAHDIAEDVRTWVAANRTSIIARRRPPQVTR